jgi:hypothetical protein
MKHWQRASVDEYCGQCRATVPAGEPFLRFILEGMRRTFVRCPTCADEDLPVDLPAARRPDPPVVAPAMTPVRHLAGLPFDWSRRRLGEREPGEEG